MGSGDRRRRVTIVDVATHAQVSTTAVSKVLRNAYGVSPAMRERVRAAIDELGYRPQAAARAMRGRTFTLGVLIPDVGNPFIADILDGFLDHIGRTDYQAIMMHGGTETEDRATDALVDRQVDGIFMVAPLAARKRLEEVAAHMPTVVLGRHDRSSSLDTVFDDDELGAVLVVEHLIALGHRRIAHISQKDNSRGRPADVLHTIRAETYKRVMREHGLAGEIAVATTAYTEEGGYRGARELLRRPVRPTAIFAGADLAAFGALAAVHEAGLSVPGDISIAGYDNIRMAALPNIDLTTVEQDGRVMGATSGRLLLERIEGRTSSVRFCVTPSLVARSTTGPCPTG